MADQKKYLRATLAECRASLTPEFARSSSLAIQRRLIDCEWFRAARAIVLYSPIQNEVATDLIAADSFKSGNNLTPSPSPQGRGDSGKTSRRSIPLTPFPKGKGEQKIEPNPLAPFLEGKGGQKQKEVFFPRLDRARNAIVVARVRDLAELASGAFGIAEPSPDASLTAPANLADAVITIPGMGFGPQGQRLGRGGGHYDRFLAELPKEAITVGLAYSFQLLDGIPEESCDRRLQYIITESALIRGSSGTARDARPEANRGGTPGWL